MNTQELKMARLYALLGPWLGLFCLVAAGLVLVKRTGGWMEALLTASGAVSAGILIALCGQASRQEVRTGAKSGVSGAFCLLAIVLMFLGQDAGRAFQQSHRVEFGILVCVFALIWAFAAAGVWLWLRHPEKLAASPKIDQGDPRIPIEEQR